MKTNLFRVLPVAMMVAVLLVLAGVGWAAFPGKNGKIAFESRQDGNREVYIMNADGTDQTRLTDDPAEDRDPAFSPDGSKIAFESDRDGNFEIYVMSTDGSGLTKLTDTGSASSKDPAFSPDGSRIAFESDRDGNDEIYVMDANGSNVIRLTDNRASDEAPAFSPDGSKIAFQSDRGGNFGDIFVMNVDGSNQVRLTSNPAFDEDPNFSPNGRKIAFSSNRDGNDEIHVMNADGSNQVRLTDNPAEDHDPAFSPDGSKIAFESDRAGDDGIYVMDASGTGTPIGLTNNPEGDSAPDWQPLAAPESENPTSLSLDAKRAEIKLGHGTRLHAKLSSGGEALRGKQVIVLKRPKGAEKFTRAGARTTNFRGAINLEVKPGKTTFYRAVFRGEAEAFERARSNAERVKVVRR